MVAEIQVKGLKGLQGALRKAESAVKAGGRELTRDLGFQARNIARKKAPRGVRAATRSLKGAITFKTSKIGKGYQARVWVKTNDRNNFIAIRNEFGTGRYKYYIGPDTRYKDLREWAIKSPKYKKTEAEIDAWPYIIIGGPKTALGKRNKFWKPSFIALESQVPKIAEKTFNRRLDRAFKGG
jgi:hypothetical protein